METLTGNMESEIENKNDFSDYDSGSDDEIEKILSAAADDDEKISDMEENHMTLNNKTDDSQISLILNNKTAADSQISLTLNNKPDDTHVNFTEDGLNPVSEDERFIEEETTTVETAIQKKRSCITCCACCLCGKSKRYGGEIYTAANSKSNKGSIKKKKESNSVRRNEKGKCCKSTDCRQCCKKFTAFLFSHIGLCSLVVAYSILGGFIFMKLEAPNEIVAKEDVSTKRKEQVERLWNITFTKNIFSEVNWSIEADRVLITFQEQIYRATKEKGWDGTDDLEGSPQWSFAGSLLYSITVITTIGYGHIAPKTIYGRLVTMFYALFGIPLTLLCLANIGSFLGDCFRLLYKHICLAIICICCPSQAKWTNTYKTRQSTLRRPKVPSEKEPLKEQFNNDVKIGIDDIDTTRLRKSDKVRVPIVVSLMVIVLYIIGGAALFASWENWDYLEGSYFCFITLSTIGFGDFVPGASTYTLSNQEKLIICSFYLIFGLSLIAMCFNLMQEEVVAKFAWLGRKLGIVEDNR